MWRLILLSFIILFIGIPSAYSNKADQISVTAKGFRLFPGGEINNRLEVEVTLIIKNNGWNSFTFDGIVGNYFVNGKSVVASQTSLMRPATLGHSDSEKQTLRSMASGFGGYLGNDFKKKIEVYLLRNKSKVLGPFTINVPDSFGY